MKLLRIELVKLQSWVRATGARMMVVFEGRDASGKGGAIRRIAEPMNPRGCRIVALDRPTERERAQWYFQRFVAHLPAAGEIVLFDRSWYNRAGLERVNGYCTEAEARDFLVETPALESLWVGSGLLLRKLFFRVSKEVQAKRLQKRSEDPVKKWRLTALDKSAQTRWDEYTAAETEMFASTSTADSPWVIVEADNKKLARLNAVQYLLGSVDYGGKVEPPDPRIVHTTAGKP